MNTIIFKDEGELDYEPIGPVAISFGGSIEVPCGWLRVSQAKQLADRYGYTLEYF